MQRRSFLKVLPACALGALIVPDVLSSIPESPVVALSGVAVAGAISLTRGGLLISVIAGVGVAYLLLLVGV